jgi:hypothetical protein
MRSIRVSPGLISGLFAGLLLSVAAPACKKNDEAGGGRAGGGAAGGGGGAAAAKASDLDLIPVESELVLGIDFAQAQKSAMFRDLVLPQLTKDPEFQASMEKLKSNCGMDPMAMISSITVGVRSLSDNPDAVMVMHGLDKSKSLACVDKMKAELEREQVTITRDGDMMLGKSGKSATGEGDFALKFVSDSTAVATFGPKANKEGLAAVTSSKSTLGTSKEFVDMFGKLAKGETVWFLLNGSTPVIANGLKQMNVTAKAIYGSLRVTDALALDLRVRVDSEDSAKSLTSLVQSQVGPLGQMVDKVDVTSEGTDVKVQIAASQQKLKGIAQMMGPMMRGMMP